MLANTVPGRAHHILYMYMHAQIFINWLQRRLKMHAYGSQVEHGLNGCRDLVMT